MNFEDFCYALVDDIQPTSGPIRRKYVKERMQLTWSFGVPTMGAGTTTALSPRLTTVAIAVKAARESAGQGQDLRAVLGDVQGVLPLRHPGPVPGDHRPAVVPHLPGVAAQGQHRLD